MINQKMEEIETYNLNELIENGNVAQDTDLKSNISRILSIIDLHFMDKKIVYFFKPETKSPQQQLSIAFLSENIMHLFGITAYAETKPILSKSVKTSSYAVNFYNDFKTECLDFNKCWVESLSKVIDKINVLEHLPEILTDNVRIGGSGDYIKLKFTNVVRTNKKILGIAVVKSSGGYSVPISALNLIADKRATQHKAFNKVVPCSKIIIYKKLVNGEWQIQETKKFNLKQGKKKKKK